MDCTRKRQRHRIFKPTVNMSKKIKVTQIRSRIGAKKNQIACLSGLGLRKINATVEHNATPQILGMVKKVSHLIVVVE